MSDLYRFIKETEFERLLSERTFLLRRPSAWKDEWEGFPFKLLDTTDGKAIVDAYLRRHNIPFESDFVQLLKQTIYCLCFTQTADDQALWSSYAYDRKAVRIAVDRGTLLSFVPQSPFFQLKEVTYADRQLLKAELEKYLAKIVYRDGPKTKVEPFNGYILKRMEFQHENEVRLLQYEPKNLLVGKPGFNQKVFFMDAAGVHTGTKIEDTITLKLPVPLSRLVKSVLVHPEVEDSFLRKVEELCARNSLGFLGRSNLYKLEG